ADALAVEATDDERSALLEPEDRGRAGAEDARALLRDRFEDALRLGLRGDERRYPPERSLLLREPADLGELRLEVPLDRLELGRRELVLRDVEAARDEVRGRAVGVDHRLVRPGDEPPVAASRHPVPDLRARPRRLPDAGEDLGERLPLLGRDDEVARVTADHLRRGVARRALARTVQRDDP